MDTFLQAYFQEKSSLGFNFDNSLRNEKLIKDGIKELPAVKTGTTIVGVVCKECVVLGADTRATNGPIVADKDCDKIHRLADNIYAAGAGTAADLDHVTSMIEGKLELLRLQMNRQPRVSNAVSMFSRHLYPYQGYIGAHLIVAGSDITGNYIYQVSNYGSIMQHPYVSMGSGSLSATTVLESGYRDGLNQDEGTELVASAIRAGIYNDLYSGSNVNILIITSKDVHHFRYFDTTAATRLYRQPKLTVFPKGTTPQLMEKIEELKVLLIEDTTVQDISDVVMA
ncbi:proteasome subunit beta type 7-B precursor, putative [Cryptosporidium muris RN66]|uniref:Proteasome subunit beta n=1 Tax=Cryptosporidium muris (strain RN66) TaxID=441375 RepID=B6AG79_CRYMR|nr:proteasome subunit beta type 7-B precursor, putative [Cryptosporidium muris RN66]EEA07220.1 proteasome subunit beta type 7-B precursor, putative [Cryptosporidium muris RN66]|eukprot:XP_002141569.1 proteasome subunit beta type 7-B precursor [Cryptosporidium muris RN66]